MKSLVPLLLLGLLAGVVDCRADKRFTDAFGADKSEFAASGTNRYFVLIPGHQLVLESKDKKDSLTITVLAETKVVDGVETRVVEERELENGELIEVSRNFFAISRRTSDVYYFGEEVDEYKHGKVTGHGGSWLSGVAGAHFGLMMPGTPLLGARYQQEVAPKVAMDRAEVVSLSGSLTTPAGKFDQCLETEETSGVEAVREHKHYAPGIGLAQEGKLLLVKHGMKP